MSPLLLYRYLFPPQTSAYTRWALFILGGGILCPWSAWVTASDYFIRLYPTAHIDRLFAVFYFLPNLLTLVLLAAFGDHYAEALRVKGGFYGYLIGLLSIPLIDLLFIRNGRGNGVSLTFTLLSVVLTGISDAVAQGSLFGSAARVEYGAHTQILMAGTAASGTLISVLRIVTKASMPTTIGGLRGSTALYFLVAGLNCAACIVIYDRLVLHGAWRKDTGQPGLTPGEDHLLLAQPSSEGHLQGAGGLADNYRETAEEGRGGVRVTSDGYKLDGEGGQHDKNGMVTESNGFAPSSTEATNRMEAMQVESAGPSYPPLPPLTSKQGLSLKPSRVCLEHYRRGLAELLPYVRRLWKGCLGLVLVFWVTLSIFPGVLTEDTAAKAMGDWFGIILVFLFNLGDLIGKLLPSLPPYQMPNLNKLCAVAAVRALFLLLYLGAARRGWGIFEMGLVTLAFGGTNGWLATNLLMASPKLCGLQPGTHQAEVGGTVLITALMTGLTLGAFSGWLWVL